MANPSYSLTANYNLALTAALTQTYGSAASTNSATDNFSLGSGSIDAVKNRLPNGAVTATNSWHDKRTVTSLANDDIVLNNGGLVNFWNKTLNLTSVVWFMLQITTPAAGQRLILGNAPTPWQAWFTVATQTEEVRSLCFKENQIDGWTVANAQTLRVYNPGAQSVTFSILLVGSP